MNAKIINYTAGLLLTIHPLYADLITIEDGLGSLPSTLAFETYDIDGGLSDTGMGSKNNRDNTQSFQLASAIDVDKFVLSVNAAREGSTVTFRLFEVPGSTTADPLVLGTEVRSEAYTFTAADATATGGVSDDGVGTDNLLTWDFSEVVTLNPGGYALQIDGPVTGPASGVYVRWRATGDAAGDLYSDGRVYRDGLASAFAGTVDTAFGIVAIPEPSVLPLLVIGVGFLRLGRRRRC